MTPRLRIAAVGALLLGALALLAGRLAAIQIRDGPALAAAGLLQRAQVWRSDDGRGLLLDRHGLPLTDPRRLRAALAFPPPLSDTEPLTRAAAALSLPPEGVAGALRSRVPVVLKEGLSEAEVAELRRLALPGVAVVSRRVRQGPGALASHLLGHLRPADGVPLTGLELQYDHLLKPAARPAVAAFVDARGRLLEGIGVRELEPSLEGAGDPLAAGAVGGRGADLILTIDGLWQHAAEAALRRHGGRGAAVVLDPRSGELMAMASHPPAPQDWLNRATSAFPPGSVFKIVVAAALWEEGLDRLGPASDPERGSVDLGAALAVSSNAAFQEFGRRLGADRLLRYARAFGLGRRSDLQLPGEAPGALPQPWEVRVGDLSQLSIGQGPLTATPLQMAQVVAAIVNDGVRMPLRLVREARRGGAPAPLPAAGEPVRVVSERTARLVREGLRAVTDFGTGREARVPGVAVAGKTGTAEAYDGELGGWVSHAWFVGYAPADRPQVVVAVFAQRGVSGGLTAAPLFAEIVATGLGLSATAAAPLAAAGGQR